VLAPYLVASAVGLAAALVLAGPCPWNTRTPCGAARPSRCAGDWPLPTTRCARSSPA